MANRRERQARRAAQTAHNPGPAASVILANNYSGEVPPAVSLMAPAGVARAMSDAEIASALLDRDRWDRTVQAIERERAELVAALRTRGVSWDGVGWVLGTTGEAARQRFGVRRSA